MRIYSVPPSTPENRPNSPEKYREDIDGLRAIAVLAVVAFHAFPNEITGGFIGVDVFFVISGFLISSLVFEGLDQGCFRFHEFYLRRVRRIFPALICVMAASLAVGWLFLLAGDYAALGRHVMAGVGFVSNFVLWQESGYFDTQAELKPLQHLWSLAIEEQYYLIWPLFIWLLWKTPKIVATGIFALTLVSFGFNVLENSARSALGFYSPLTRFWELLIGSLLALFMFRDGSYHRTGGSSLAALLRGLLGLTLLGVGFWIVNKERLFPGWWALFPTLGTILVISAGQNGWVNSHVLSRKWLVSIGLISYPLYLWHWPLLSFARIQHGAAVPPTVLMTILALSFVLAGLTFRIVEKPFRYGPRGGVKAATLVLGLVFVGAAGYFCYDRHGLPERFPPLIRGIISPPYHNWDLHARAGDCHIYRREMINFPEVCFETKRPLVVLWGDSHAASLYVGLQKLQEKRSFGIIQGTRSDCPPIFGLKDPQIMPGCQEGLRLFFEKLVNAGPDVVIMHAQWNYGIFAMSMEDFCESYRETLQFVRASLPGARIVVVGPVPHWGDSAGKTIYESWLRSLDKTKMPERMLVPSSIFSELDAKLRQISENSGARYVSAVAKMCNDGKCISRFGSNVEDVVAHDYGHLNEKASQYLVSQMEADIFQ